MNNLFQFSPDLFAAHQQLLIEQLQRFLGETDPFLSKDAIRVFQEPGKLLYQSTSTASEKGASKISGTWPLLVFFIAQSLDPTVSTLHASSVAIAVESLLCAFDLLDDIEDDDQTALLKELGLPRALNVSTFLQGLAQHAILSLVKEQPAPLSIIRMLDAIKQATLTATTGQHKDLLAESQSALDLTEEECIEMASRKAGALMQLACILGALCANASDHLCELFSELGKLSGIAHQLDNDSHDLYYLLQDSSIVSASHKTGTRSVKTDIVRNKKTLPIVLAARTRAQLQDVSSLSEEEQKEIFQRTLHEGIIATWGISLLYRTRAREYLQKIEVHQPVSPLLHTLLGLQ